MADKQIIIDYKTLCENYSKEVGCCNTFDGSCSKEECFTYRLLRLLQTKEKEREDLKQTLIEIKEIAGLFCNLCQEFEPENRKCTYCNYGKILQKISEVENEN